ncbi:MULTISPECIES: UvrY/SirA/GacA family response regulator transcription factor [Reinekea]|jgi:DNA-binding NarL/FixJ family response regulator|uniref:BarA-associated response regulator UvrY n=1 Tax=Reinekea forsetii TaxID=1336806 RepID=A0A2K8KQ02_9GAMM|nr:MULTISPECIES: UvrY/SirA/GacA family response regulator transcription factor [Reinekea]ATX76835.1 BarA-associated response regulator UvrY [Reinekea forsetii]MDO7643305.1 UvrY/SirA/GacA family response regulator transcription factor [Reinekea forsetii]
MVEIIVIDDHDLVRFGLVRLLADVAGIRVVADGNSGQRAVDLAKEYEPDVILMDVRMPGMDGIEATKKIQRLFPEIKIIAVTACDDDPFPARLLQAGASGYLTKGASTDEMIQAIKTVMAGKKYLTPTIAQKLALQSLGVSDNPFNDLSDREMQIATMICSCKKVQAISDTLCLSPKTVNTYRYRVFEKLSVTSDVELTHLAIRYGLLEPQEMV